MSLLTDGPPADIEYLRGYESAILDVAQVEEIDLDTKLRVAAAETGDAILRFLLLNGTRNSWQPGVMGLSATQLRQSGLKGVVVTPSLRRWHAFQSIQNVYREAYGNQLNERYAQKLGEYSAASRRAAEEYFQIGVGLVGRPVSKAAPPTASTTSSGDSYFVQASWVDTFGNEGTPSDATVLNLGSGSTLAMTAPPDSAVVSWNVYLGSTRDILTLQNSAPIAVSGQWMFTGASSTNGRRAGSGQQADYFVVNNHVLPRG